MPLNPAKMARPVHADGRRYVPAIDGLRCLAAWGVISAHIGSSNASRHLVAYYGAAAYPALIVFFTISGFLVYRPFARNVLAPRSKEVVAQDRSTNFWVYLLRRVLRIFPLYWTVLGATCIAMTWFPPGGVPQDLGLHGPVEWLQAIFLIPIPDPMVLLHGPLGIAMWTLAIELPFYVIVPLYAAGLAALRRAYFPHADPFRVLVTGVTTLLVVIFGLGVVFGGELAFPVTSLPMGMLFAILETRQSLTRRRYRVIKLLADHWYLCLAAYVALVLVAAQLALDAYNRPGVTDPYASIRNVYFPIQMALALLLFIPAAFGKRKSWYVLFMSSPPLQMLAPLTYGIYLWHVPLIRYTEEHFGQGLLGFPVLGTQGFGMPTLFIAIGLAIVTFVVVELPAARLRRRVDAWSRGHGGGRAIEPPIEVPVAGPSAAPAPMAAAAASTSAARSARQPAAPARTAPRPRRRQPSSNGSALPWCEPLDGFRAVSACVVVVAHTFLAASLYPFPGALHLFALVVPLFFAISAYVLYQPFAEADVRRRPRPSAGAFYIRRLLRIYPLYAIALTAYLVILPEVRPDDWSGYVRLYLLLQVYGRELGEHIVGIPAAWYLCDEVFFYLCIPVVALVACRWANGRRRHTQEERLRVHLALGWGLVVAGPLVRQLLLAADVPAVGSLPFAHLEFFGSGVVLATYAVGMRLGIPLPSAIRWIRDHVAIAYVALAALAASTVVIANLWGNGRLQWTLGALDDRLRYYPYLAAVLLLMITATLGAPSDPRNRWLSSTWFKPIAVLSLHIYLWHQLVLALLNRWFDGLDKVDAGPRVLTGVALVVLALVVSIAVARLTQPITDWPYERYRATHHRPRRRGTGPRPRRTGPSPTKALEPQRT